jgi:hypothetical protein
MRYDRRSTTTVSEKDDSHRTEKDNVPRFRAF